MTRRLSRTSLAQHFERMQRRVAGLALIALIFLYLATGTAQPPRDQRPLAEPPPPDNSVNLSQDQGDEVTTKLVRQAQESFARVRDYQCMLVKQERVNGKLLPEQTAIMKVRNEPFAVHLRFVSPSAVAGREACYVEGKLGGKMRGRAGGLMGAVGFITLEVNDRRVMADNRHVITEAGVGNLIRRIHDTQEQERRLNLTHIRVGDYSYNRRPVTRLEAIHPVGSQGMYYCYRCVTYFDKETFLPIRFEAYDYPRPGGSPHGDLLECYSYQEIRFNVGLGDAAFAY